MSRVDIVFAETFDAEAILSIYSPYILMSPATFEIKVPSAAEFARRIEAISGEFPYLLLFVDSELVGYAYAHKQAERAAFAWNAETSIYLRMDWSGKGLGRPLYALLIDLLAMQGYVNVYGVITSSNAGSIAMHEKLGFQTVGVHEKTGYKFDQWHGVVWMHKRIGGDGAPGEIRRFDALDQTAVSTRVAQACAEIEERLKKAPPQQTLEDVIRMLNEMQ